MYELTTVISVLRAMFVIDENKAYASDTENLVDTAGTEMTLPHKVRRIRVAVNDVTAFSRVWFCWGATDRTGNVGGRVLLHPMAPLEIILERPEDTFWFRRVAAAGTVTANLLGTP